MAQVTNNAGGRRRFRLQGKNFIITWPKCNETKEDVLGRVQELYGEALEFAVVSHENHQDGTSHLHAILSFKEKRCFSGANCFDNLANSHGNYQTCRQVRSSVKYVVKDGDFTSVGIDVTEFLLAADKKQSTKATLMAQKLAETNDLVSLNELDPGFVMMNLKKIKDYQAHLQIWMMKPPKKWIGVNAPIPSAPALSPALAKLAGWLSTNLGLPRRMRQKQLLLSSPPGFGKTTLKEALRQFFTIYDHADGKWFCEYDPGRHDIICFEEFRGLPLTIMNKVMDGSTVRLETKGGSIVKDRNCPVLILTNLILDEMFTGPDTRQSSRAAFFDRVEFIRLEEGDEAWRLLPLIEGLESDASMTDDTESDAASQLVGLSYQSESSAASSSSSPLPWSEDSVPNSNGFLHSRCDDY